jgi:uncharacterized protein (DUF1330 family)
MSETRHEILIGMHVTDETSYAAYRAHMTPILESMGGFFRYDMRVSELLQGHADDPFNRLFIISFPDEATKDRFFNDERYIQIKRDHFEGAVRSFTLISAYDTNP